MLYHQVTRRKGGKGRKAEIRFGGSLETPLLRSVLPPYIVVYPFRRTLSKVPCVCSWHNMYYKEVAAQSRLPLDSVCPGVDRREIVPLWASCAFLRGFFRQKGWGGLFPLRHSSYLPFPVPIHFFSCYFFMCIFFMYIFLCTFFTWINFSYIIFLYCKVIGFMINL